MTREPRLDELGRLSYHNRLLRKMRSIGWQEEDEDKNGIRQWRDPQTGRIVGEHTATLLAACRDNLVPQASDNSRPRTARRRVQRPSPPTSTT